MGRGVSPIVRPKGFEPLTVCLEGRCSIQLSYERIRYSTSGRGRTGTDITVHRILSPACLPIPPPRHPFNISNNLFPFQWYKYTTHNVNGQHLYLKKLCCVGGIWTHDRDGISIALLPDWATTQYCYPAKARTWTLLNQNQTCCQLHHRAILRSRSDSNWRIMDLQSTPLNHLGTGPLGWMMGFEPTTFWTTIRRSNLLNYNHHILYRRWDSNPHTLKYWFLRPACLPFHHFGILWLLRDSNPGPIH